MPRPSTPTERTDYGVRVVVTKRCCNGCGREIGDATPDEVTMAIVGWPLPDVRQECGCADA